MSRKEDIRYVLMEAIADYNNAHSEGNPRVIETLFKMLSKKDKDIFIEFILYGYDSVCDMVEYYNRKKGKED